MVVSRSSREVNVNLKVVLSITAFLGNLGLETPIIVVGTIKRSIPFAIVQPLGRIDIISPLVVRIRAGQLVRRIILVVVVCKDIVLDGISLQLLGNNGIGGAGRESNRR